MVLSLILCSSHPVRWDPERRDLNFFNQSACLYANYYQLQIAVHRQYIPTPRRNTAPLLLPSLTICTSAARSCISVLDAQYKRTRSSMCALTPMHMPLVTSCTVLLVHLWGGKPSEKAAQALWGDVQKCLQILKDMEAEYVRPSPVYISIAHNCCHVAFHPRGRLGMTRDLPLLRVPFADCPVRLI